VKRYLNGLTFVILLLKLSREVLSFIQGFRQVKNSGMSDPSILSRLLKEEAVPCVIIQERLIHCAKTRISISRSTLRIVTGALTKPLELAY
jgi:hypothetical protein